MQKLKEQLPTIVLIGVLVIGAAVWTLSQVNSRQDVVLAPLREQNDALKSQLEDARRQLDATNQMLKEAIGKRDSDLFRTDVEIQKLNGERIDALADAIAKRVVPAIPGPKTPEEAAQIQNEQVDKVSARMAERLRPIIAEASQGPLTAAQQTIEQDGQRIQKLNDNLRATEDAAQQALKLSHEVSALYLDSFKDQGLVARLASLPGDLVRDAASGSIVTSRDRDKSKEELSTKMEEIERRLNEIQTQATKS